MVPLRVETLVSRLRDLGIASPQQIEQAKQELASTQERFSVILVRQGLLRDTDAGKRLAAQLGSLPQRLDGSIGKTPSARHIPDAIWHSHRLMPLREQEGRLLLATDDPFSAFALDFFGGRCGCLMEAFLIREDEFQAMLDQVKPPAAVGAATPPAPARAVPHPPSQPTETLISLAASPQAPPSPASTPPRPTPPRRAPTAPPQAPEPPRAPHPPPGLSAATAAGGDEPIIRLVDSLLSEAVRMRASDIHIEPGTHQVSMRYRIDGVLHDVNSAPTALHGPIVSRIKIMAGLNIAEKRLPQDGRLQLTVERRPLDVRISILPATHGESIVMRLLDRSQPIRGLAEMGMGPDEQRRWDELIHRPHGMVLVTGPTGSGKTTTLYGALAILNQPDRKLITVEDPVEYQLAGVNQVLVRSSIGLTFAAGLRSMLRQAPDVIMVGEIRDQETAQIAVQAALTGHLVFSTLHTNDAPSAITRLIDMGIPPFLIASTVQGVLAQRLVRRICPDCRITDHATAEERAFLGPPEVVQVIRSNGCDRCHGSGYFGRIGVFELVTVSDAIRQLIVGKPTASAIRRAALAEGVRGLRDDGCMKIREGLTTMAEVLRVVVDIA
jgi:type II secretory ATPase GspE/PulE/Tfp pilus assembly ATPase PilB-like protein